MNKKPVLPPYTRRPIAAGLVAMYKEGRWTFAVERMHRRSEEKIRRILAEHDEVSVELGGAKRPGGDGWVRLDLVWQCDVYWNLARGLPFPADRVNNPSITNSRLLLEACHARMQAQAPKKMRAKSRPVMEGRRR